MKTHIRFLFRIPVLAILAATIGLQAETFTHPDTGLVLRYTVSGGEATVTGGTVPSEEGDPHKGQLVIPRTLGGYPVTTIDEGAFSGFREQSPVVISVEAVSVRTLKKYVFNERYELSSVSLPAVESVHREAFYRCTALIKLSLPKATSIGYSAFQNCSSLESVFLPEVESLEYRAFSFCSSLTKVYLGKVPELGSHVFKLGSASLTIYHHAEHLDGGEWADYKKQVVARPFAGLVASSKRGAETSVGIPYASGQKDWSHAVERSTDLRDWVETKADSIQTLNFGSFTVESHTFDETGVRSAFYRVQAKPEFFQD